MALTAAQIVTLACQDAKCPGYTSQAGQLLNVIGQELCQDYDFDLARGLFNFAFHSGATGSGPYNLPADYLRADPDDVFYTISGVPYPMINITLPEYDGLVQQAGINSYPDSYATDMSQSPPVMYVWPPASGAFPVTVRYRRQMPDVAANPEQSNKVPWFPNTQYLRTRLAAELMGLTDDERRQSYLKEAEGILTRYLKMADDKSARAQMVSLDRRQFGNRFNTLKNTKTIGW